MEYAAFIRQYKGMNYCTVMAARQTDLRIITTKGRSQKQKENKAQAASKKCKLEQNDKVYQKSSRDRIGMQKWGRHEEDVCIAKMAQKIFAGY